VKRVNSYGIGLLLQRDTKGAWTVFEAVTERAPQFIEGLVNLARTQLADGSLDEAARSLRRVFELDPEYPKALYLMAALDRQRGDYEGALALFKRVEARYPKDRVLCNEIAQLYYLTDRYREAVAELEAVLAIDPENLSAHYYLMLSYDALGERDKAREARARYLRYKPEEAMTALGGPYRARSSEAGLEAQPVHVHE
jgi:tetratricopeptide (TPR) repeat protein